MDNKKRAIEESFPIVEINKLAVPERNAFKPIYTMHKWFARRSSSVFRAILLAAMKPAGTDIMEEFYKDHTNDPDTNGKVILDPFMGGGTTIVEALRLGCKVIGIDLNPVAWFIVKTEVEPVDIDKLKDSFERLSNRIVGWSGKSLKETLLDLYKTECPACGNKDADIIYTFWVKLAPCTTGTCNHLTQLFSDYVIAHKNPSIRYYEDCKCPECGEIFDWEIEPAALIGNKSLMISATQFSAGAGRASTRWTFGPEKSKVECPWCNKTITPAVSKNKKNKKKVPLSVLYCPSCEEVWQYRGEVKPDSILECPTCKHNYNPNEGNLPAKGKFICHGTCNGNVDAIISAIRKLPKEQLLPIRPYAVEGYCEQCAGNNKNSNTVKEKFFEMDDDSENEIDITNSLSSILIKNNGKFFKRFSSQDMAKYQTAKDTWEKEKGYLPYPKSEVPVGEKTKSGLIAHHYNYWHQMFNERQLLALSTLLQEIDREEDQSMRDMMISSFQSLLNDSNMFTWYQKTRDKIEGIFTRHDFTPKMQPVENNVYGVKYGKNTWISRIESTIEAKKYNLTPFDKKHIFQREKDSIENIFSSEKIDGSESVLFSMNSAEYVTNQSKVDFVITDPPYGGNVNYAELSDYFYVWVRLSLFAFYKEFSPEYTPKSKEVIENKIRGKSAENFRDDLSAIFIKCAENLNENGILSFTFHHQDDKTWELLLDAVSNAGFFFEAIYPIHGEAENSPNLIGKDAISYDLIHICKKREKSSVSTKRSWAGIRQEIKHRAKEEIELIESGRYGNETLLTPDVNIILIGKCLELYSKYYGNVVDYNDKPVPIKEALEEIKMMVDLLLTKDNPLPSELEDIDVPSYIYLTALCANKEITIDAVSKIVRGIIEPSELREYGLIIKGREAGGRTFKVKQPLERLNELKERFRNGNNTPQPSLFNDTEISLPQNILFVDVLHLLLGLAETGDSLLPWLEKFGGLKPQIRAALEHIMNMNKNFIIPAKKVLGLLDERTLFANIENSQQKKE